MLAVIFETTGLRHVRDVLVMFYVLHEADACSCVEIYVRRRELELANLTAAKPHAL